jgi:hypothetical protein
MVTNFPYVPLTEQAPPALPLVPQVQLDGDPVKQ